MLGEVRTPDNTHWSGISDHRPLADRETDIQTQVKYEVRSHTVEPGFKLRRLDPVLDKALIAPALESSGQNGHCPRVVQTWKNVRMAMPPNERSLGTRGKRRKTTKQIFPSKDEWERWKRYDGDASNGRQPHSASMLELEGHI